MKKFFTLIAASVLTVAAFAADHRPVVTLTGSRNYEIVIDGRSYFSSYGIMDLSDICRGQHSIKVYEMNRRFGNPFGGFGGFIFNRGKRLVDASYFEVNSCDLYISVDFRGQIRITEGRFNDHGRWNDHDRWNDRRDNRDDDWNNGYGHDQRDNQGWDHRDDRNDGGKHF